LKWLSGNELGRLEHAIEQDGKAGEELWADLHRRALARALLDTDMVELDRQERATGQLLRFDHPDRPGDPMSKLYITVTEDLVERGRWYLDDWYVREWRGRLPSELTTAEVMARTCGPWPPSPAAPVA
jgi:hypothetical protein